MSRIVPLLQPVHAGVTEDAGCALWGRKDPTLSCLNLPEALILTDFSKKMEEAHHTQYLTSVLAMAMVRTEVI